MGPEVTIAMSGTLQLSLDGIPSRRPLEVAIEDIVLHLPDMMEAGMLKLDSTTDRVVLTLENVTLTLSLDAQEVLTRGGVGIMDGIERERLS